METRTRSKTGNNSKLLLPSTANSSVEKKNGRESAIRRGPAHKAMPGHRDEEAGPGNRNRNRNTLVGREVNRSNPAAQDKAALDKAALDNIREVVREEIQRVARNATVPPPAPLSRTIRSREEIREEIREPNPAVRGEVLQAAVQKAIQTTGAARNPETLRSAVEQVKEVVRMRAGVGVCQTVSVNIKESLKQAQHKARGAVFKAEVSENLDARKTAWAQVALLNVLELKLMGPGADGVAGDNQGCLADLDLGQILENPGREETVEAAQRLSEQTKDEMAQLLAQDLARDFYKELSRVNPSPGSIRALLARWLPSIGKDLDVLRYLRSKLWAQANAVGRDVGSDDVDMAWKFMVLKMVEKALNVMQSPHLPDSTGNRVIETGMEIVQAKWGRITAENPRERSEGVNETLQNMEEESDRMIDEAYSKAMAEKNAIAERIAGIEDEIAGAVRAGNSKELKAATDKLRRIMLEIEPDALKPTRVAMEERFENIPLPRTQAEATVKLALQGMFIVLRETEDSGIRESAMRVVLDSTLSTFGKIQDLSPDQRMDALESASRGMLVTALQAIWQAEDKGPGILQSLNQGLDAIQGTAVCRCVRICSQVGSIALRIAPAPLTLLPVLGPLVWAVNVINVAMLALEGLRWLINNGPAMKDHPFRYAALLATGAMSIVSAIVSAASRGVLTLPGALGVLNLALLVCRMGMWAVDNRQKIREWIAENPYKFMAMLAIVVLVPICYKKGLFTYPIEFARRLFGGLKGDNPPPEPPQPSPQPTVSPQIPVVNPEPPVGGGYSVDALGEAAQESYRNWQERIAASRS